MPIPNAFVDSHQAWGSGNDRSWAVRAKISRQANKAGRLRLAPRTEVKTVRWGSPHEIGHQTHSVTRLDEPDLGLQIRRFKTDVGFKASLTAPLHGPVARGCAPWLHHPWQLGSVLQCGDR